MMKQTVILYLIFKQKTDNLVSNEDESASKALK